MTRRLLTAFTLTVSLLAPITSRAEDAPGHKDKAPRGLVTTPTPGEANALLVAGNGRFARGSTVHPRQDAKRLLETAGGQHPFVTVLSCSDSRVPPEIVFDTGIGDLFSVRVAGNVADTDEMGSVEYGVDHLGTPLLVVLGHTKCGAVTAVATTATVHGHIPSLVAEIGPAVAAARAKMPNATDAELVPEAIRGNVFESMATLLRESDAVRERVESGKVQMVGAVYDLSAGTVEWLGPHPEEASLVAAAKKAAPKHGGEHGDEVAKHGEGSAKHGESGATHGSEHGAAADHKDAGAGHGEHGKEAKEGHGEPPPPPQAPAIPPYSFALVALLCTLGGAISGRASK
jgi:carbonic anhydrase